MGAHLSTDFSVWESKYSHLNNQKKINTLEDLEDYPDTDNIIQLNT